MAKKSKAMSIASFVFGLMFWIPLINLFFGIIAIYLGVKSLKNIRQNPELYGGGIFARAGIALGVMPMVFSVIGLALCIYGMKDICVNMGLWFLG